MEEAFGFTNIDGEFRYEDERTKKIDGYIEMARSWINILEITTLRAEKKRLIKLIKQKEAYVKGKMKELSETKK